LASFIGFVILSFFIFGILLDTGYESYYTNLFSIAFFCYFMLCWSLYKAARTNPGYVPKIPKSDHAEPFDEDASEGYC